jgi:hypothetical protein
MGKASRLKRERRHAKHDLLARIQPSPAGRMQPRANARGMPKISASLGELIQPYVRDDMGLEAYRKLVTLGATAWNCAVEPDLLSNDRLRELLMSGDMSDPEALDAACRFVEELKQRKDHCFPDDRRSILGTEVRQQSDGSFYLLAAVAGQE